MPELPEVEVVRRGLERWTAGRTVAAVEALHPRAVRRHTAGAADFSKVGRNEPCPCGSGRKFKLCHGDPRNR